jgi:alkanesulfonate monooxygenase SsuD/methylene tetrahydromethanopterin reductase-like flavin-dependent oxidoreductase (luciferase family)
MQARRAVFSHIEADPHIPAGEEERDGPPQPAPALRFSCDVCLLPFNHPIRLAEDLAVLDNISNGRVEVGIGMGYAPHEFRGFGLPVSRRVSLTDEGLAVLRRDSGSF